PVRGSEELLERIRAATVDAGSDVETGVIHYANEREHRGGFSLYVPEYWDSAKRWPLVVALHGGSGHGRDFLWTWLREARSRGFVVLSATARDRTWSIVDPDVDIDAQPMLANVRHVMERFNVHPEKVLLTGLSDGATYAMLHGLMEGVPYTHLAALSGVFHPVNDLRGTRNAGLDVPHRRGADDARSAHIGRSGARLPRDRRSLPYLCA
ncbi:MAG: PHB depolymerase family esterase, partial [Gammaproteobacteria bacterium]